MSRYSRKSLSRVLHPAPDEVVVEPDRLYQTAGLYSFGRGLFARPPTMGADTKYRSLNRIHKGQFVVARLNGWEGAIAVVEATFDGMYMSQEFPSFDIDQSEALPEYLSLLSRWPAFWTAFGGSTHGSMVRRKRIHPEQVLEVQLPLPDLGEQRRIVAHLRSIVNRLDAAGRLVQHSAEVLTRLPEALAMRLDLDTEYKRLNGWRERPLGSFLRLDCDEVAVDPIHRFDVAGVYGFGRGLFRRGVIDGTETTYKVLHRLHGGQLVMSRLKAWEGALAVVDGTHAGMFVSPEFPTFTLSSDEVDKRFLAALVRSPSFWESLRVASKGVGARRERVQADTLLGVSIWVPPSPELDRIGRLIPAVMDLLRIGASRESRLAALLPSVLNQAFSDPGLVGTDLHPSAVTMT